MRRRFLALIVALIFLVNPNIVLAATVLSNEQYIVANVLDTATDQSSLLYVTGVDYFVTNTENTPIDNLEIAITLKME